jgi:UDP-N-acetylmuramate: L-alanyl-gamma-D-glutamyl-meso-diaminopimelate ligase
LTIFSCSLAIVAIEFFKRQSYTRLLRDWIKQRSIMHLHILGICGTFMGSLALLARDLGHKVTGSDANVYPPMSTQLENAGIELMQGYDRSHLQPHPDLVIVGNAMKRGIDAIEYMLNEGLPYISGPQF